MGTEALLFRPRHPLLCYVVDSKYLD